MELTILERLLLLDTLPKEGSIVTLRIVRDLNYDLALTEEEMQKIGLREVGSDGEKARMLWDPTVVLNKDISIGEKAYDIIVEALKKRDREGRMTVQYIPLYERFVEKKEAKDGT